MTLAQQEKLLKIKNHNASDKALRLMVDMDKYGKDNILDAEAEFLARHMTGQQDWQGVKGEFKHFSGLAKRANAWLARKNNTSFRIVETYVEGDGTSTYHLK